MGTLTFSMPDPPDGLVIVRLETRLNGLHDLNEYYFSTHTEHPYAAAAALCGGQITATAEKTGADSAALWIKNTGKTAVLHLSIEDASDEWNLTAADDFRTLLPGESWRVAVAWSKRFRVGFDEFSDCAGVAPELVVAGVGLDEDEIVQWKEQSK